MLLLSLQTIEEGGGVCCESVCKGEESVNLVMEWRLGLGKWKRGKGKSGRERGG